MNELLKANHPAKVAANLIFLAISAYLTASVMILIPRDVVGKVFFAVASIGLDAFMVYNLAVAKATGRILLFIAYGVQVVFVIALHVLWGIGNFAEVEKAATLATEDRAAIVRELAAMDSAMSAMTRAMDSEGKTGVGWKFREVSENFRRLKAERAELSRRLTETRDEVKAAKSDAFTRVEKATGVSGELLKILIFAFLSVLIQFVMYQTAWTIPDKKPEPKPAEATDSGLRSFFRTNRAAVLAYAKGLFRDSPACNGNEKAAATAAILPALGAEIRRALSAIRWNKGPIIESRQGGTVRLVSIEDAMKVIAEVCK